MARNGAIQTGRQPDGRILTVIDLDVALPAVPQETLDGLNEAARVRLIRGMMHSLPAEVLDPVSRGTFVVRTPKGGFHVYFYTASEMDNAKDIEARDPRVAQVDRRGFHGLIFPPGCAFADAGHWFQPYEVFIDQPIVSLSDAQFWAVWDGFARYRFECEQPKDPAKAATKRHHKGVWKARAAGKKDVPPEPRSFTREDVEPFLAFPPCVAIIMAHAALGHHLYHEERLFVASFLCAEGFDPEGAIEPVFARMPDFDAATTHAQVAGIAAKGYKPAGCRRLVAANMCPGPCGRTSPR